LLTSNFAVEALLSDQGVPRNICQLLIYRLAISMSLDKMAEQPATVAVLLIGTASESCGSIVLAFPQLNDDYLSPEIAIPALNNIYNKFK
jgi:hypothetical protein